MIEQAVKELSDLLDTFQGATAIRVINVDHIELEWADKNFHKEEFYSSIELIEWMENNLKRKK